MGISSNTTTKGFFLKVSMHIIIKYNFKTNLLLGSYFFERWQHLYIMKKYENIVQTYFAKYKLSTGSMILEYTGCSYFSEVGARGLLN